MIDDPTLPDLRFWWFDEAIRFSTAAKTRRRPRTIKTRRVKPSKPGGRWSYCFVKPPKPGGHQPNLALST